jgi:hypothetical protein
MTSLLLFLLFSRNYAKSLANTAFVIIYTMILAFLCPYRNAKVKLPAHRAKLPGNEISFFNYAP